MVVVVVAVADDFVFTAFHRPIEFSPNTLATEIAFIHMGMRHIPAPENSEPHRTVGSLTGTHFSTTMSVFN